ncbi:hypothetical protein J6590_097856, partial [Homalodisca vitripennis]
WAKLIEAVACLGMKKYLPLLAFTGETEAELAFSSSKETRLKFRALYTSSWDLDWPMRPLPAVLCILTITSLRKQAKQTFRV